MLRHVKLSLWVSNVVTLMGTVLLLSFAYTLVEPGKGRLIALVGGIALAMWIFGYVLLFYFVFETNLTLLISSWVYQEYTKSPYPGHRMVTVPTSPPPRLDSFHTDVERLGWSGKVITQLDRVH